MKDLEKKLINQILPLVTKPGRYIGNELNVIKKDWSKVDVTFALVFPDLYELGMSYIGFEILYHILNRESYIAAERVFAPGVDLEKILKERELPLFSLEGKQPLRQFDVLGFTLQYELHYSNILNILNLGGLTLSVEDRGDDEPIILAGGPCAYNPEPIADFIDAFVIGDGEEVVLEIARFIREAKISNLNRQEVLKGFTNIAGVYVPQFYETIDGKFSIVKPTVDGVPSKIFSRTINYLNPENYPHNPLIPLIETTHDRYSMEIMRGCTRGCRFCNAGIIYRPVRERTVQDLVSQADTVIKNTGYEEISLVSLSTSDYSQLQVLLSKLTQNLNKRVVNVSFPSLRAETFTPELAKFAKSVRKSSITLAPEAGTEYLRGVINKNNTNEDLLRAVNIAFQEGWNLIKLYFMIGQPGERNEDLEGIASLINQVVAVANKFQGKKINVSISPFSPKPHTPFQWAAQDSIDELNRKILLLKQNVKSKRVKLNWRDPEISFLEAVLGRGDKRLSSVIKKAWELGAKFDAWGDFFKFSTWDSAFKECGIDPTEYTRERELNENLPWDHINKGVTKSFLKYEFKKALKGQETSDCRLSSSCNACGLMEHKSCQEIINKKKSERKDEISSSTFGRSKKLIKPSAQPTVRYVRLKYSKGESIRFTSHLDMIHVFERAFRRSDIKLVYSQGFHPHPKISYGPSLTTGFSSEAEYLDVQLYRDREFDMRSVMNKILPPGVSIINYKILFGKCDSLVSVINRAKYKIQLNKPFDQSYLKQKVNEFLNREQILVDRRKKVGTQQVDIKPFMEDIVVDSYPNTLLVSTIFKQGKTVRVSEILNELLLLTAQDIAISRVTRIGLYVQTENAMVTPMEI